MDLLLVFMHIRVKRFGTQMESLSNRNHSRLTSNFTKTRIHVSLIHYEHRRLRDSRANTSHRLRASLSFVYSYARQNLHKVKFVSLQRAIAQKWGSAPGKAE